MASGPLPLLVPEPEQPLLEGGSQAARTPRGTVLPFARASPIANFTYGRGTFPRTISACALAEAASENKAAEQRKTQRKLIAALVLAFVFMVVEVVAGVYAHSLAIITDAAHLLSDVSGFAISVFAAFWVAKKSREHFSYGYHRVEVLGALASVLIIWLVTGVLVFEAVNRVIHPEEVKGKIMFIVAMAGIGVNLLMMFVLGGHHHGHGHSHGHDHGHSQGEGEGHGGCGAEHSHGPRPASKAPKLETVHELSRSSSVGIGAEPQSSEACMLAQQQQQQQRAHAHHKGGCHNHSHDSTGHGHSDGEQEVSDLEAGTGSRSEVEEAEGHDGHHHHGGDCCSRATQQPEQQEQQEQQGSGGHSHGAGEAGGHGHGHGHGHGNINLRGAVIHVLGDLLQSIGVAVAGAMIWANQDNPSWYIVDPICTFIFAGLVMLTTFTIIRDIADVLMERVPRGLCIKTINDDLSRMAGVEDIHDLHVWSLTPGIPLLCAHISLEAEGDPTATLHAVTTYCRKLGIEHSTFQLVVDGRACPCSEAGCC